MIFSLLVAASALSSPPYSNLVPTVNLSAIRQISCDEGTGSGYLIGKDILVTDVHVASLHRCIDVGTGKKLKMYKQDPVHDLALMTGKLPEMPYIKISCAPYKKGETYMGYGVSDYYASFQMFRQNSAIATGEYVDLKYDEDEGTAVHISWLKTTWVPGMSGGPVLDRFGYSHGNVVAGGSINDIPVGDGYSYELKDTFLCKR